MPTTEKLKLPPFFVKNNEGDEGDAGNEALQDFFLAWTLRCAAVKYKDVNPKIYEFSRRFLYALIYGEHNEAADYLLPNGMDITQIPPNFRASSIVTFRQIEQIDLFAEVVIEGDEGLYIINIENKFYSSIGDTQLDKSKQILIKKYPHTKIISLVIYCDGEKILYDGDKSKKLQDKCTENGYKFPDLETLGDLIWDNERDGLETGNDLFDEYWFGGYRFQ